MHDVAKAQDLKVAFDPHATEPGEPTKIVAAEVDEHVMLGELLLVQEELPGKSLVLILGGAARAGTRERIGVKCAILEPG